VIAMNLNTCSAQDFNANTTPTIQIALAVRASMSIPIYFSPVYEPVSGHYFSDGGIYFPSPFKFITDSERIHTLSLAFNAAHKPRKDIKNMQEFLFQLYYSLDYETEKELQKTWGHSIMYIDCKGANVMNFEATQEEKTVLMELGRESAENFLRTPGRKPMRRFSLG
jgi:NTE family protein